MATRITRSPKAKVNGPKGPQGPQGPKGKKGAAAPKEAKAGFESHSGRDMLLGSKAKQGASTSLIRESPTKGRLTDKAKGATPKGDVGTKGKAKGALDAKAAKAKAGTKGDAKATAKGGEAKGKGAEAKAAAKGADAKAVQGKAAQGKAAQGKATEGKAAQGKALEGKAAEGKAAEGKAAQGKLVEGKATEGKKAATSTLQDAAATKTAAKDTATGLKGEAKAQNTAKGGATVQGGGAATAGGGAPAAKGGEALAQTPEGKAASAAEGKAAGKSTEGKAAAAPKGAAASKGAAQPGMAQSTTGAKSARGAAGAYNQAGNGAQTGNPSAKAGPRGATAQAVSLRSLHFQEAKDTAKAKDKSVDSPRQQFRALLKQWASATEMAVLQQGHGFTPHDAASVAQRIATLAQSGQLPVNDLLGTLVKLLKRPGNKKKLAKIKEVLIKKGVISAGISTETLELIAAMIALYLAKTGNEEAEVLIGDLFSSTSRQLMLPEGAGDHHQEGRDQERHAEYQRGDNLDLEGA